MPFDRDVGRTPRALEKIGRDVDARDAVPGTRERSRVTAGTASDIKDFAARRE